MTVVVGRAVDDENDKIFKKNNDNVGGKKKNWLVGGNGGEAETEEPFRPGSQTHFCHLHSDWARFFQAFLIHLSFW